MRKIIASFIKHPIYATLFIITVLIGGTLAAWTMKSSFFPESTSRIITVSVAYPGASPKEMEEGITSRVEEAVRGLVGIKEITSNSMENFTSVTIETTGEYDIDETLAEVKNAVDGISSFPVNAERPIVAKQRSRSMAMFMSIYGDVDLLTLKKYAYIVEEDLRSSGTVSQLTLVGIPSIELSVEIPEMNLLRYNLTFSDVQNAIAQNNIDLSGGVIRSKKEELLIRSRNRTVDPDILNDIIVKANPDGTFVRIRDIGSVKLKFDETPTKATLNGQENIAFIVNKLPEEDLAEMTKFLEAYVEKFNEENPEVTLEITWNFMTLLNERLEMLTKNGIVGLLLVMISLGFFLRFWLSVWVAWGIPASFLAMFVVANSYGLTINMISLFGMILVIGILVDDGIVIAENIFSHFEKGKNAKRAAIDGTMEVMPAVTTSITTTVIAFLPVLFITEQHMQMLADMAFVVIVALLFSLVEAFFVLPAHLAHNYVLNAKNRDKKTGFRTKIEGFIKKLRASYARVLETVIRWRWVFVSVPLAMLIITVGLFKGGIIAATFFPAVQFDTFNVNIAFTPGTGEEKTLEYLYKFEKQIWEVNEEIKEETGDTLPYIKYTALNLGSAFNNQETGSHCGRIEVYFHNMEARELSSFDISNKVYEKIGKVPEADKFLIGGDQRFGKPISISLLSKDLEELQAAKTMLIDSLTNLPQLKNVLDNNPLGKQEVRIKLKDKAYFLGLTQASIANIIRQGFFGGQAQRLQEGKDEIRVWVRYPKEDRTTLGQLEKMKITTPKGQYPLSELVDYQLERGPVNIKRYNMKREVRVEADLVNPYDPVPPILEKVQNSFVPEILDHYPGISVEYQGQSRSSQETMQEVMTYFSIAFFVIGLIIIIHFKSVIQAFMVVSMIPIGWLGSAWGHGLEAIPLSMLSVWGMVALSGVIINDAVVFMSRYNQLLMEGMKVEEAAYHAGLSRFRPILLTSITTVLGLYPIIFENSFQAEFLKPMAVALAYGVLFGTGFMLLFFPTLILVINDIKYKITKLLTGKEIEREDTEVAVIYSKRTID